MKCRNCKYFEADLSSLVESRHFGTPVLYDCVSPNGCISEEKKSTETKLEVEKLKRFLIKDYPAQVTLVFATEGEERFNVLLNLKDGESLNCRGDYLIVKNGNFGIYKMSSSLVQPSYKYLFQVSSEPYTDKPNDITYVDFPMIIDRELGIDNRKRI